MRNELKRRLKRGEQVYGTWITLESPMAAEMMSTLGFDYFVFDTEHSPLGIYQAQTLMQAMRGDTTTPIVRAWWNDIVAIKRALDIGAYGVVVPWVNNREQAELAVKATRYAPKGLRGCGPRRASMFDPDYYQTVDEEILVICQIETEEAVENIDDIVSVEGVDVSYIGPADLSASYGHLGNQSHPNVQEAIDRVYDATKAAGKAAGIHMGSGKTIEERIKKGYNLITIGNDLTYLKKGVLEQRKRLGLD
ncbi:MAG: 4-hydroxy-2-oxo-heptane-1,7-dioate aldolase [Candidatus Bathyarchaeota archaeon]|nr:MAG: 4-hydroxy-2-oxo-heptane-1,7-dioate aldolase [Candidatus Bathyarchaeota archaeon]